MQIDGGSVAALISAADLNDAVPRWIAALGGLAGFGALMLTLLQNRKKRRVPPNELLDLLLELEHDFSSIIAEGGKPTTWFLEPDRQRREMRLAMISGQLVDDRLNDQVGKARGEYMDCFTWAQAPGSADDAAVQKQVDSATHGRGAIKKSIDRANHLRRRSVS